VSGVTFGHHGGGFEDAVGDFGNRELFVIGFLGGDDGGIWGKHEMDSGIGDEIGLEFSDIDVQSSIESKTGGQRWDDLGDKSIQVGVSGSFDI